MYNGILIKTNHILLGNQLGFREQHSYKSQLLVTVGYIDKAIKHKLVSYS